MKLIEKILVATDFSEAAHDALRAALAVAGKFRSKLVLLHVIPGAVDAPLELERLQAPIREQFADWEKEILTAGLRVDKSIIAHGTPFDRIIHWADVEDVNVIFVGSEQKSTDSPFRLGVTPERLIRKSDKPVWVVKPGSPALPRKILCAVDFSDPSRRALTNAIHLARQLDADLTVLHVLDTALAAFAQTPSPAAEELARKQQERQKEFDGFLAGFHLNGVRVTPSLRAGGPSWEILNAVRDTGCDLLVMGSVGRTGLPRILLGSVAEKVVRELPCSVITVKAEHVIRVEVDLQLDRLEAQCAHGEALLEKECPAEALQQFEACLAKDHLYLPAWEGAAVAHDKLGHTNRAERCRAKAVEIQERLHFKKVEQSVRSQHWFWRKP
ncbi:MAG: universal stress protein [Verrucomicrobia bacterium]|nr:universal stress protein [Verrucomicrobiota bacterium]